MSDRNALKCKCKSEYCMERLSDPAADVEEDLERPAEEVVCLSLPQPLKNTLASGTPKYLWV